MNGKKTYLLAIAAILLLLLAGESIAAAPLQVSFIDVGQGDSALIQDMNGFDILIDGGRSSAGPTVVAFLANQGVDTLEVMVASHPDSDHIGGLIDVLQDAGITVSSVYYNGYPGDTATWYDFATAVADEGAVLEAAQFPQVYTWGDVSVQILNPLPGLVNPDSNDASVVMLVDNGPTTYLFTGDIDTGIESQIIARGTPILADILKVTHHGSSAGTSAEFLDAVMPAEAVISVGDNSYGHPTDATLARLADAGVRVWRTDTMGDVIVTDDGSAYLINGLGPIEELFLYLPVLMKPVPPTATPTATATVLVPTATVPAPTATATATQPGPTQTTPPQPSPTPTNTLIPPTPTRTSGPPPTTGNIVIDTVFFDGVQGSSEPDEYVVIHNIDSFAIQLQNWTLRDEADHVFTFPAFVIQPSQVCRVYTNENHPEWCGFNYGSGSAIWNNSGDCAYLRNSSNALIDEFCY